MASKKNYEETLRELAFRELARRNYIDYLRYVNKGSWKETRFAEFVANTIQEFTETDTGNAYDILILESPPQHGKSMTVTESFPSWWLGKHPEGRVVEISYNEDTATRFLRRNKEKMKRQGKVLFNMAVGGADRSDTFELASGGSMISRGVTAGVTGNPCNLMIIDDPIKNREEADSESSRNKLWAEWLNSFKSRLYAGAKVIVIMTPWHEDDLRARMMKSEKNVRRVRLPVEAEDDPEYPDPLGRSPGEPLCPELGKDEKWLQQFKESYLNDDTGGARAWSALYMCNPVVEGGNMVQRSWWKFYDTDEVTSFGTECISVDATFKDSATSDYVAIQVWGKVNGGYYLRHRVKKHLDFPATVAEIKRVRSMFPNATRIYIEDKANGSAIIQVLSRQISGVVPVNPLGGKVARVNAVSPFIEVGHVYLPKNAPWIEEYLKEWSEFPAGKHDDEVDATSQALAQLQYAYDVPNAHTVTEEEEYEREHSQDVFGSQAYDVYNAYSGYNEYGMGYDVYGSGGWL